MASDHEQMRSKCAIGGFVLVCFGGILASHAEPDAKSSARKPPEVAAELHNYDPHCGLLSLAVKFGNEGERPVYVIYEDFGFVRAKDGSLAEVPLEITDESMTIDFSRQKWKYLNKGHLRRFPTISHRITHGA